jgi:uncharacterized protein (TIGR02611 family)
MSRLKKSGRKIAVGLIGFPVIAVGIALLVLPGPGLLVIAAGLAILALEFEWADRHLKRIRKELEALPKKIRSRNKNT